MPFTQSISELVLVVPDAKATARFYQDVVGLEQDRTAGDYNGWFWTGKPGESQRLLISSGPLYLEEHSPLPADKRWGRVHFAFEVTREDLDRAVAHVRNHQVEVFGPNYIRWMKAEVYYFFDPDGNLLEFWSPDPSDNT